MAEFSILHPHVFWGSFLHKIYFVNKDYDRKNKMSISRQDVALQEYRDFCHHYPC